MLGKAEVGTIWDIFQDYITNYDPNGERPIPEWDKIDPEKQQTIVNQIETCTFITEGSNTLSFDSLLDILSKIKGNTDAQNRFKDRLITILCEIIDEEETKLASSSI